MTTFKKNIRINASSESVWAVVSNLGDIYKYHPGVSKSYLTTTQETGIGAARICELYPVGKILETASSWEEGKSFVLDISPIEKAPPVKNFTGKFELNPAQNGQTEVSLIINYNMKLGFIGNLLNQMVIRSKMEAGIEDLLKGLKVHIEQGVFVKDTRFLTKILRAA